MAQSRVDDILESLIDGEDPSETIVPQSRVEELLEELHDAMGPSDQQVEEAVSDWLDDHPEATTTVEDGAISYAKLDSTLKGKADDVDDLKSAVDSIEDNFLVGYRTVMQHPETVAGSYVKGGTGEITESASYTRTDYVDLTDVTKVKLPKHPATINALCFYDSSKTWISPGIYDPDDNTWHNVPSGAKYLIYSGVNAGMVNPTLYLYVKTYASNIQEQFDAVQTQFAGVESQFAAKADIMTEFGTDFVKQKSLLENIEGVVKFPGNLVDYSKCVNNAYVTVGSSNAGVVVSGQSNYYYTGLIPVTAGTTYKANKGRNCIFYNSSKVVMSNSGISGTGIQTGVTAPEGAAYILFNVNKTSDESADPSNLYFAATADYNATDVTIPGLIAGNALPWCHGKKINWIGDSIVDGTDFDEVVCSALGLIKATEYGINGSTIALKGDGTDGRNALCIRYDDMSNDADLIAVSCGTNDWMYAWCPIGTIESTENTTFYGAMKTLCEGLIDKYPQKLIFFTTPIKRAQAFEDGNGGEYTQDGVMTTPFSKNKYGLTLGDYADIITEVCGYYSIPVLDMYRESLLNPHITSQQTLFDSAYTHPNTTGQKIMARRVAGWLTQLGYTIAGL